MRGTPIAYRCSAPVGIEMTGRGRRLVMRRNGAGFPALKNDGTPISGHRHGAPDGLHAGDVVRVDKHGATSNRQNNKDGNKPHSGAAWAHDADLA